MSWGSSVWGSSTWGPSISIVVPPGKDDFLTWVRESLPRYFVNKDRTQEMLQAFACVFEEARVNDAVLWSQTLIGNAVKNPTDYLNLHALGRGTSRQASESSINLRDRLQNPPEALTPTAVLQSVQDVIDGEGISGTAALVELRNEKAFFGDFTAQADTGGEFVQSGSETTFTPTNSWAVPPKIDDILNLTSSTVVGNDGTHTITAVSGDSVTYTNASGATSLDVAVNWEHRRANSAGVFTGFSKAYLSRGYRMTNDGVNAIIVIMPFGCTASTETAVREALRQKKGAGTVVIVECRLNP